MEDIQRGHYNVKIYSDRKCEAIKIIKFCMYSTKLEEEVCTGCPPSYKIIQNDKSPIIS